MDAAHEWHIRPSELGLCDPDDDVSVMIAYLMTTRKMSAWECHQAEKKARQQERRRKR